MRWWNLVGTLSRIFCGGVIAAAGLTFLLNGKLFWGILLIIVSIAIAAVVSIWECKRGW